MENTDAIEQAVVFSLAANSHLTVMIMELFEKEQRLNRDEGRYSFENYVASLLEKGVKARDNYLDTDEDRRNLAAYNKAKERIPLPPPLDGNDPATIQAHIAYSQADVALRAKHKIGGSKQAL